MLNLKEEAGEQFRNAFRGNLYGPREEGYEEARKSYNAMTPRELQIWPKSADKSHSENPVQRA